ncbi:SsgA family sporulation/cell division regulator [Streptacidiphilus jiangxiensis]|uniref:Streptomyces sporulation and cell division protein, SsgA n=1 Tax=Streptacidiphilus jiangxiensis TaxID=235985 RepID=A0A1H7H5P3_STRJI|nr:SsgA family sporulation/cell division regulator [Streptacidiphilus jiangxiensis]SEK45604.1 Streptomyces sporulation and cell division protein, SsgA [Streptacidiphilus jiangxiensis]
MTLGRRALLARAWAKLCELGGETMRVVRAVQALLLKAKQADLSIPCSLGFSSADPYAVRLSFPSVRDAGGRPLTWCFARELLLDGLRQFSGRGDVFVLPAREGNPFIELHSGRGIALLQLATGDLVGFLAACERVVPLGTESNLVDWDEVIDKLLDRAA